MSIRRIKIITAANPLEVVGNAISNAVGSFLSPAAQAAGSALDKGVETFPFNAVIGAPVIADEAQKWVDTVTQQKSPEEVKKVTQEAAKAFADEEKLINLLASRMGVDSNTAAALIQRLSPLNYSDPNATHLDRESLINALLTVFNATSSMGLDGKTEQIIDYFEIVLSRSGDAEAAAKQVADDMSKIQKLTEKIRMTTSQMFEVYYNAVKTNNFGPVYAMIAVMPLLNSNIWSLTEKLNIDVNSINMFTELAQKFSGLNVKLSPAGEIVKKLNGSFNKLKIAWLPIKKFVDLNLLTKVAKWNETKAQMYRDNKERFQAFHASQRSMQLDLVKLNDQFRFVNLPTGQAPSADMLKSKGASLSKKYRIIVAQAAQSKPGFGDEYAILMQSIMSIHNQNVAQFQFLQQLWSNVQSALSGSAGQEDLSGGVEAFKDVFTSAFAIGQAMQDCDTILDSIPLLYNDLQYVDSQVRPLMNSPELPDPVKKQVDEVLAFYKAGGVGVESTLVTLESKVQKVKLILPYVRQMQIDTKKFSTMKKLVSVPSNKFAVPIPTGKGKVKVVSIAQAIGETFELGMTLVDTINATADGFASVPDPNFANTAEMLYLNAQNLEADVMTWKDQQFGGSGSAGSQISTNQ